MIVINSFFFIKKKVFAYGFSVKLELILNWIFKIHILIFLCINEYWHGWLFENIGELKAVIIFLFLFFN